MQNTTDKNNKAYLKKLNKIKNSEEYLKNEMQINCIKNVLIEHSDVPAKLLDWLIESVEQNALLVSKIQKYKD